jgi:hypothetical protein
MVAVKDLQPLLKIGQSDAGMAPTGRVLCNPASGVVHGDIER